MYNISKYKRLIQLSVFCVCTLNIYDRTKCILPFANASIITARLIFSWLLRDNNSFSFQLYLLNPSPSCIQWKCFESFKNLVYYTVLKIIMSLTLPTEIFLIFKNNFSCSFFFSLLFFNPLSIKKKENSLYIYVFTFTLFLFSFLFLSFPQVVGGMTDIYSCVSIRKQYPFHISLTDNFLGKFYV